MNRRIFLGSVAGTPAGLWLSLATSAMPEAATTQLLADGFAKPPDAARPLGLLVLDQRQHHPPRESPPISKRCNGRASVAP
jgi:hypothetical protein